MFGFGKSRDDNRWWEEAEETPTSGFTPKGKNAKRWFTRIYVWSVILLFPPALLSIIVLAVSPEPEAPQAPTTAQTDKSAGAQMMVEEWLSSDPAPVPEGRVVSFTGSKVTAEAEEKSPRVVVYTFVVQDARGLLYTSSVQVAESPSFGQSMIGVPGLMPIAPSDGSRGKDVWPWKGLESSATPQGLEQAINQWLEAYLSGDAAKLKQAVGDPEANNFYLPLFGAELPERDSFDVTHYAGVYVEGQDSNNNSVVPKRGLARVSVPLEWGKPSESNSTSTGTNKVTYDVLIDRADTASPVVVAWGNPGAELQPYGNAIPREVTFAEDKIQQSPTPATTPAPSPTKKG